MIFCIDSHIFIWAIKKEANPGQEHHIIEAKDFFAWIDDEGHTLMVPALVIAECLAKEPIEKHIAFLKIVSETMVVVNFDERAALVYAEILNMEKWDAAKKLAIKVGRPREIMKIDYLIVACALANNATAIYSHDKDVLAFANGLIEVRQLPPVRK